MLCWASQSVYLYSLCFFVSRTAFCFYFIKLISGLVLLAIHTAFFLWECSSSRSVTVLCCVVVLDWTALHYSRFYTSPDDVSHNLSESQCIASFLRTVWLGWVGSGRFALESCLASLSAFCCHLWCLHSWHRRVKLTDAQDSFHGHGHPLLYKSSFLRDILLLLLCIHQSGSSYQRVQSAKASLFRFYISKSTFDSSR